MLLHKIALALVAASLVAGDSNPRIPEVTNGCPDGYRVTQKCCKNEEPALCCPSKQKLESFVFIFLCACLRPWDLDLALAIALLVLTALALGALVVLDDLTASVALAVLVVLVAAIGEAADIVRAIEVALVEEVNEVAELLANAVSFCVCAWVRVCREGLACAWARVQ
ncbi:hypothetical protein EDD21DRAFT_366792 [Dissophora ornata]|nr:hypothetical protein EDD21DRAFT_366792 [Dissophora ornata]